jgi:hypothetical protein
MPWRVGALDLSMTNGSPSPSRTPTKPPMLVMVKAWLAEAGVLIPVVA